MGLATAPWDDRNKMALGFSPLCTNAGGEAMNISEIISIIHDVLSMVYMFASSAYKLSKDIHGSERKPAPEGKRNNRRKRR